MGDMNETLGENPALMSSICVKYHLHDAFSQMYPDIPDFTTYIRGSKRKDYMLISNDILSVALGYNQFYEIHNSDHRGMYLDLPSIDDYSMNQTVVAGTLREIGSKSKDVTKFVNSIYLHLHQNKVFHKFETLLHEASTSSHPWILANEIDDQVGLAINLAKKVCFKYPRPPWSEILHHASLTLRYWIIAESSTLNNIPNGTLLLKIQHSLPALEENISQLSSVPATRLQQIKQFKSTSLQQLREARKNAVELRREFLVELRQRIATRKKSNIQDPAQALAVVTAQTRNIERFSHIRATKKNKTTPLTKVTILRETSHLDPSRGNTVYRNQITGSISDTPTYTTIDVKDELDQVLLARNRKHFSKAKDTLWNSFPSKTINKDTNYNLDRNIHGHPI